MLGSCTMAGSLALAPWAVWADDECRRKCFGLVRIRLHSCMRDPLMVPARAVGAG